VLVAFFFIVQRQAFLTLHAKNTFFAKLSPAAVSDKGFYFEKKQTLNSTF